MSGVTLWISSILTKKEILKFNTVNPKDFVSLGSIVLNSTSYKLFKHFNQK